jgi:hypothetical protein
MLLFLVVASRSLAVTPDVNAPQCSPARMAWIDQEYLRARQMGASYNWLNAAQIRQAVTLERKYCSTQQSQGNAACEAERQQIRDLVAERDALRRNLAELEPQHRLAIIEPRREEISEPEAQAAAAQAMQMELQRQQLAAPRNAAPVRPAAPRNAAPVRPVQQPQFYEDEFAEEFVPQRRPAPRPVASPARPAAVMSHDHA